MEYALIFAAGVAVGTVIGWLRLRRVEQQLADLSAPTEPTYPGPLLPDSRARRAGL